MRLGLPPFLLPPRSTNYERMQRARLFYVMLLAALTGALYFAIQNILLADTDSAVSLFFLAAISLVALLLNYRGYIRLAALLFGATMLGVLDYALFAGGSSLHDPGIVVYPIFILCAMFLFGEPGFVLSLVASIASVALLYLLEANRVFTPQFPSSPNRVIGLSVLFIITALVTWMVNRTWENHLMRLQQSYDLTLKGWAKALEYRDGEVEGHSQRVTELCSALARKLGLAEDQVVALQRGALMHDIGKMAVPDRILFKAGPLDEAEWAIMKQHPTLARDMLTGIPYLQSALDVPYFHHENWDGTGYPQGLKGEEIPLAARIFAVIDHWDALSSDRPYHKAWPRERILSHLKENAGKLYDPRIVDTFLALMNGDESA